MAVQRGADDLGRVRPLHTGVHAFCALAENGGVDLRLVECARGVLADVIQRIAGESDAGTHADIEIEFLAHGDDGRVVDVALPLQFGLEFGLRGLVWLRRDCAEETELVLGEEFDGAIRQGIALRAPAVPSDIGMDVVGVKADGFENP